ncbi:MAG: ABC transporter permease [Alkaliphilus sp.]
MVFIESFRIAISAIYSNKMRTLLTLLGLLIGIASVIAVISLGDASVASVEGELATLGINNITIMHERGETFSPDERLTIEDSARIGERFQNEIEFISPKMTKSVMIKEDIDEPQISLEGVSTQFFELEDLNIIAGRFLNEFELEDRKNSIVIDSDLAADLFGEGNPIGERIFIQTGKTSNAFLIVGVYEKEETLFGAINAVVYTPYSTMDKLFRLNGEVNTIVVGFKDTEEIEINAISDRIIAFIEGFNENIGEGKYSVFSAESIQETVGNIMGQLTIFIAAIAGISLIVGGIGVMNIMLVSVTERTREIGVRKALGAQHVHILLQFLIEAVSVSLLGGILGIGLGYALVEVAGNLMGIPTGISFSAIALATSFAIGIGLFFGIYPANKAAKLDPIVALRYE